jgi:hypothetical protein
VDGPVPVLDGCPDVVDNDDLVVVVIGVRVVVVNTGMVVASFDVPEVELGEVVPLMAVVVDEPVEELLNEPVVELLDEPEAPVLSVDDWVPEV